MLTKQGLRRKEIDEIMVDNYIRKALDVKNCIRHKEGEIKIENLTMKAR